MRNLKISDNQANPLQTRPGTEYDEAKIQTLMEEVYGRAPSWRYYWNWRHLGNPAGKSLVRVAVSGDKIIGHVAVMKLKMKFLGHQVDAGCLSSCVTHPGFQRKGIFNRLVKEVCADAVREGIKLVYIYPNRLSYAALKKHKLILKICRPARMYRILNIPVALKASMGSKKSLEPLIKPLSKAISVILQTKMYKLGNQFEVNTIQHFDNRFDVLWENISHNFDIFVIRNSDYLNHHYTRPRIPVGEYKIFTVEKRQVLLGFIVVGYSQETRLKIGKVYDIGVNTRNIGVAEELINRAEKYFIDSGVDVSSYISIEDRGLWKHFKKMGYFMHPVKAKEPLCLVKGFGDLSMDYPKKDVRSYFQIGDIDFI